MQSKPEARIARPGERERWRGGGAKRRGVAVAWGSAFGRVDELVYSHQVNARFALRRISLSRGLILSGYVSHFTGNKFTRHSNSDIGQVQHATSFFTCRAASWAGHDSETSIKVQTEIMVSRNADTCPMIMCNSPSGEVQSGGHTVTRRVSSTSEHRICVSEADQRQPVRLDRSQMLPFRCR